LSTKQCLDAMDGVLQVICYRQFTAIHTPRGVDGCEVARGARARFGFVTRSGVSRVDHRNASSNELHIVPRCRYLRERGPRGLGGRHPSLGVGVRRHLELFAFWEETAVHWSDNVTARPILTAVIAFVVFTGTTGARTQTSQTHDQARADPLAGGPQIMSRGVTQAEDAGQTPMKKDTPPKKKELSTKAARLAFIRKAQIWSPTNVSQMDLRAGPEGAGSFQPNEAVTCDYVRTKLTGTSPKFDCDVGSGDVVKVRYGAQNGKVEAAVIASRLLWALGFGADRLYPVVVRCR